MGGHGHGHHETYVIPKPEIYKVENVPELKQVKDALEKRGLRDPWLRNEVWRYDVTQHKTHARRLITFMGRGFLLGVALTAVTIGAETLFGGGHGHGHHGHGDEKEGGHH